MGKKTKVNVQDYYSGLSKKNKSQFLTYLMKEYGMNYSTTLKKFCGTNTYTFRQLEIKAIEETIEKEEEWKKDFYGAIGEYVDNLKDEDYLIDFIEKLLAEREEEAYKRGYLRCKMEKTNKYLKLGLSFVNADDLSAIEYISKKEEYSVYDNSKVGKDRFTYRIHLKTGVSFETTLIGEEELSVFDSLKLISKLKDNK